MRRPLSTSPGRSRETKRQSRGLNRVSDQMDKQNLMAAGDELARYILFEDPTAQSEVLCLKGREVMVKHIGELDISRLAVYNESVRTPTPEQR